MNTARKIAQRMIKELVFCFVLQFAFTGPVFAQCNPAGTEFQVNTYTPNTQRYSSAAGLSGGSFVVTWPSNAQDGSGYGVYGQVFNSSGSKVGAEFQVNTFTTNDQDYPSVAGLSGGGFVVTWTSNAQDGSGYGVYGQVFDSSGSKVGDEFPVNTYTPNNQDFPSVAALSGGGFVVAWNSWGQDGDSTGVYGQRFSCKRELVDVIKILQVICGMETSADLSQLDVIKDGRIGTTDALCLLQCIADLRLCP